MNFEKRVKHIQKIFLDDKKKALLVMGSENIYYLTNFYGSFSVLILTSDEAFLLVDGRYYEQARKTTEYCKVILFENLINDIQDVFKLKAVEKVFFDAEDMSFAFYSQMKNAMSDIFFVPCDKSIVKEQRMIKDEEEIAVMREGVKKAKKIMKKFFNNYVKIGMREKQIAAQLEFMIKNNSDGVSFDTIVATGRNSSLPHAIPGNRKLTVDDILLIDYGIKWKGYCTDHTNTYILGANKLDKYYNIVKKAIEIGLNYVKPNNPIKAVDENIRAFFDSEGLLKNFLHSSGHGIGLNVHEKPTLSYKSDGCFREGMVLTIEPALYFEGLGGIRIEEMFVVTKEGYEIL